MIAFSHCRRALVSVAFLTATLQAQQPPTHTGAATQADSSIRLDVAVDAKSGASDATLRQQDFSILDNKNPTPITSFQAMTGSSQPVEVVLVIDAVNTTYTTIGYERSQLAKFLEANGGHLAYPTALAIVTDTGTQMENEFSRDGKGIEDALKNYTIGLRDLRRSSGIYGADERFQLSLRALQMISARVQPHPGRKLVLWLSPGWPILSGPGIQLSAHQEDQLFATAVGMSNLLRQSHITLYSVDSLGATESVARQFNYETYLKGVSKPNQMNIGNLSLQVLAVQSGGLALNSSGVANLLDKCIADADSYYELSFQPAPADAKDEYHHIDLKVGRPGVVARTRDGYYSQP